jgi:hypothetical protein
MGKLPCLSVFYCTIEVVFSSYSLKNKDVKSSEAEGGLKETPEIVMNR